MFVLRYKQGQTKLAYGKQGRTTVDVGGEYIRHFGMWKQHGDGSTPSTTKDLKLARVYYSILEARNNWESPNCDIVEVKIELV